jgi:MFS transporter, putative metabolite:H+ symporter
MTDEIRRPGQEAGLEQSPAQIIARLDRISVWSLPYLFIGIIGLGFLFTFYDIFDINVSFIQSCIALKPGCTPTNALSALSLPLVLNLAGYVVGTLVLSPIADRVGRRNMLLFTMLITGLGSLYTALVGDYANFNIARFITGIGVGADLAIVNTYINEVAPPQSRAKYTSMIFIMSTLGAFLGVWIGIILTTPAAPFPEGVSFAQAGPHFSGAGWRWMYGIGALLGLVGVLLRVELPESPRWLVGRGRSADASKVVAKMEAAAQRHGPLPEPTIDTAADIAEGKMPYRDLFSMPLYVRRVVLLVSVWLLGYVTVYAFAAGFTSLLTSLKYKPPEAGLIVGLGVIGFVIAGVVAVLFGERIERKFWLPISAVITIIGGLIVALAGSDLLWAVIGAAIVFFGFNFWVPMTYAWSAENFPTRARTTGFALVDGVGHLGGGVGVLLITPYIPDLGPLLAFLLIGAFLVAAALIAQLGTRTRGRLLEEVSP